MLVSPPGYPETLGNANGCGTPAPSWDAVCLLPRLERRSEGKETTRQLVSMVLEPSAAIGRDGCLLLPGMSPDTPGALTAAS